MAVTIEELEQKKVKLHEAAKAMIATADAENREMSDEEQAEYDRTQAAFASVERDIANRRAILEQEARIAAPVQRITQPDLENSTTSTTSSTGIPAGGRVSISDGPKGAWGWRNVGQFASAVRMAARGKVDPRLIVNAPTSYGSESSSPDGGFAVPPDFRQAIMVKVLGEDSLLSRTDQQTTSSNQITVPTDETTPWATSGGLQVAWEAEAAVHAQSKPALQQTTVRAWKLAALIPVTEELLEDTPALTTYLNRKVPEKFNYKINDAIVNGTGVGQPLGILKSAAKVAVAKESSQSAASVVAQNVVKMYARMPAAWLRNAVWLVNPDVFPQLQTMVLGGSTAATPIYLPPGGLSAAPYGTLMGRPVIPTDTCATMGTEGDIIFTDLTQYLTVTKVGGLRQDVSIHLWFDYDVTAFKFVMRLGGQPWWSTYITPASGTNYRSSIVTTAVRP